MEALAFRVMRSDLTLRGQSHPVDFEALAGVNPEGQTAAQAAFSIDRIRWGGFTVQASFLIDLPVISSVNLSTFKSKS